jgi:hypothetical protein
MNTAKTNPSFGNNNSDNSRRRRSLAQARWNLLRRAIRHHETSVVQIKADNHNHDQNNDSEDDAVVDDNNNHHQQHRPYSSIHQFPGFAMLQEEEIEVEPREDEKEKDDYCVKRYTIPTHHHPDDKDAIVILTRERSKKPISLREMAIREIDNTGNICVWDSAKTLAWALQSSSSSPPPTSILEVGAGMAGIAALSMIVQQQQQQQQQSDSVSPLQLLRHVTITDGNEDCIRNNQACVQLMKEAGLISPEASNCTVECHRLVWSIDPPPGMVDLQPQSQPVQRADWVLVADCTHYENYHAALLWTLITHTRHIIWMCQPNRGRSWQKFEHLIQAVNQHHPTTTTESSSSTTTTSSLPLLEIQECHHPEIEAKHEEFCHRYPDVYNPDIHRPRIFRMQKLRSETEVDRLLILEYIREQHKRK